MPGKLLHPIKINGILIKNNIWLAPMAGYTGKAMREFARKFGAGLTFTEMVSLEGLVRGDKKTLQYIDIRNEENTIIQLFGKNEPDKFYRAGKILMERAGSKLVDINFGCPVRKVIRSEAGSYLLKNSSAMEGIVKALKDTGLSVSAKIRSGFDKVNIEETIPALTRAGADMITLHPRLATQFYNGNADWKLIEKAGKLTNTLLIASGDVKSPEDAKNIIEQTKADGLMIGRKAVGAPYIFKQIIDYFEKGAYEVKAFEEIKELMLEFAGLFMHYDKNNRIIPVRTELIHYVRDFKNSREIRHRIALLNSFDELKAILKDWQ